MIMLLGASDRGDELGSLTAKIWQAVWLRVLILLDICLNVRMEAGLGLDCPKAD